MPKASVIIPTYNRADYICDTVRSVLEQTYRDFEVIVVDDGSTDDTLKRLEVFSNKIKIVEQPNSERAVARNHGIKISSGEYVALLDSDDLWFPDKLEKQVKILDENHTVIMCYGQSLRIDDKSNYIKSAKRQLQGFSGSVFEKFLIRNFVVSATPLARRKSIESIEGFQTKFIPYEDWEFWARLSLQGDFHYINEPLASYRIHPQQSVKLASAKKIEDATTAVLESLFTLKNLSEELKNKSLGLANLRFAYWYLIAGDVKTAKEKLFKAASLYPKFYLDPRWYGLRAISVFPSLQEVPVFKLKEYH